MTRALPGVDFLGHATLAIELAGVRVLTDPVLRDRFAFLTRRRPLLNRAAANGPDIVLISHLHRDHCDLPSLRSLGHDVPICAPPGGGDFLRERGFGAVRELRPGEATTVGRASIRAVTAVHDGYRKPFGPPAESVGYLLEGDGTSVYFAGDTALFPGMARLHPELDLALLPVWGWGPQLGPGHMDPEDAANAASLLGAKYAVAMHWGTFFPAGLALVRPSLSRHLDEPLTRFLGAMATSAPLCRPVAVQPGHRVVWPL